MKSFEDLLMMMMMMMLVVVVLKKISDSSDGQTPDGAHTACIDRSLIFHCQHLLYHKSFGQKFLPE